MNKIVNFKMRESFEWKGYFSLPNDTEQIPGILKFNPVDGLSLDLFGQFQRYQNPSSKENNLILGFTEKGKKLTLLNCYEDSRSMSLPGFPTSRFSALHLLVGKQFSSIEEIIFDRCEIEYVDLNHWIAVSGFEKPVYENAYNNATIKYNRPERIIVPIKPGWQLQFEFQYTGPMEYFSISSSATLSQQTIVLLVPEVPQTFSQFLDLQYHFQKFLAIGYFQMPYTSKIHFFQKKETVEEGESNYQKLQYFFGAGGQSENKYKEHRNKTDFLLRYKDYGESFNTYLEKWFFFQPELKPSIDMLSEAFMKRGLPSEFYFTGMMQAMENLHRKTIGGKNKSLRQRLDDLMKQLSPYLLRSMLHNEPNFLDRIVKNRNHYTHLHSTDETFIPASLTELFILAEKLKIMLIALLLQEMGFSQQQTARQIITKSVWLFNHLIKPSESKDGFPDLADRLFD